MITIITITITYIPINLFDILKLVIYIKIIIMKKNTIIV